jgi:hypothetical protein
MLYADGGLIRGTLDVLILKALSRAKRTQLRGETSSERYRRAVGKALAATTPSIA